MIEHNKNFYSLEELERTRDSLEGYLDNEEVYYFVGAIRYACDEIERLNNIINEFEDILKRNIKACNNKFENMFDRNYRRLILEEKLEQLQELKGSDKE